MGVPPGVTRVQAAGANRPGDTRRLTDFDRTRKIEETPAHRLDHQVLDAELDRRMHGVDAPGRRAPTLLGDDACRHLRSPFETTWRAEGRKRDPSRPPRWSCLRSSVGCRAWPL